MNSGLDRAGTRAAGWALVVAAAATMVFMAHHPTSAHDGARNQFVHGVLIALTAVGAYGFLHWSRIRGSSGPPSRRLWSPTASGCSAMSGRR
jgi:ABC-type uncharacterized transport system permease subunit